MTPVSVLLVNCHYLTSQGIASLLTTLPEFHLLYELDDYSSLESETEKSKPDLIILAISDKENNLMKVLTRIKKKSKSNFLIISDSQKKSSIQSLLDLGIQGIITQNCKKEEIKDALYSVQNNSRFFCSKILDIVLSDKQIEEHPINSSLSTREYEVLCHIVKGQTTQKISEELSLSIHTVNSHRKNILNKLQIKTPAELIVYALKSGLVSL